MLTYEEVELTVQALKNSKECYTKKHNKRVMKLEYQQIIDKLQAENEDERIIRVIEGVLNGK